MRAQEEIQTSLRCLYIKKELNAVRVINYKNM